MKETRMPPAQAASLVANSGNTIYGVSVINFLTSTSSYAMASYLPSTENKECDHLSVTQSSLISREKGWLWII